MAPRENGPEPELARVLGGRGGAVDATVPVIAFVVLFTLADAMAWT